MSNVFRFKQFDVDQEGCAMKINTDGVLLAVSVEQNNAKTILDIGTGTGVIALMLSQRFTDVLIDAVEIDPLAAETAQKNFANSPYSTRLSVYPKGFKQFFEEYPSKKYDLIISNPPFFINSLKSKKKDKELARHADKSFFETLISVVAKRLTANGCCCLILPLETSEFVKELALPNGLFIKKIISICSYSDVKPHREVLVLSRNETKVINDQFVIYDKPQVYSKGYEDLLKHFFTIF